MFTHIVVNKQRPFLTDTVRLEIIKERRTHRGRREIRQIQIKTQQRLGFLYQSFQYWYRVTIVVSLLCKDRNLRIFKKVWSPLFKTSELLL